MSVNLKEYGLAAYGELLDTGSGFARAMPAVNRLIAASNDEYFRLSRWRRSSQQYDDIRNWIHVARSEHTQSIRPITFAEVALLSISTDRLRRIQERFGGRHAVAYHMGQTAMIGTAVTGPLFEVYSNDPERAVIAMGIGKDNTDFNLGVLSRQDGFISLVDNESFVARLPMEGLQKVRT